MDIVVGRVAAVALPDAGTDGRRGGAVEASLLAVRGPRGGKSSQKDGDERRKRRSRERSDPPGSRVLTLLVTDPQGIPEDVERGGYRVLLRFIRQS